MDKVNKPVIPNSDVNPDLWDSSSAISTLILVGVQDLVVATMKSMVSWIVIPCSSERA
jgi:uncharacterized membrane protein